MADEVATLRRALDGSEFVDGALTSGRLRRERSPGTDRDEKRRDRAASKRPGARQEAEAASEFRMAQCRRQASHFLRVSDLICVVVLFTTSIAATS